MYSHDQIRFIKEEIQRNVITDKLIRSGVPVINGTRIPVGMIIADIANDSRLSEIADDMDIDFNQLQKLCKCLSVLIDGIRQADIDVFCDTILVPHDDNNHC